MESTHGQLPRELAGFELPPHRSWARFYDDPRTVRGGAFEDPVAERTFLRFQTRSRARWDVVGLNLFCLPAVFIPLGLHPCVWPLLQVLLVSSVGGLLLAAYLPDRAMLSPWLKVCRLERVKELRPTPAIEASEVRAAMQAFFVFLTLLTHAFLNSVVWFTMVHLAAAVGRGALAARSLPYGSMLAMMFIVRCRPMQHYTMLACYWALLALLLGAGLFAQAGPMREMGAVDAVAVFSAVVGINVAITVCTTAVERRERWLFLCVVGSRREGLAARLRSVAATATAVAPPFAAAQLHTVMTPGEAAALAPVCARAAVGVADLADFAKFATGLLPQHTVRVLHKLFVAYDEGARRFGVDRAGSFADGYAVVSGLGAEDDAPVCTSAAVLAAARRVSDFALWQVKAGAPAVAWEVFGAEEVFLSPRAAVSVGRVAGGLVGAGPCLRFLLHGPAVDSAVALLKQGGGDEALITPKAAAAQGWTPAVARARGFSLGPWSSPGASSTGGSPSPPLSVQPTALPAPSGGTAKRRGGGVSGAHGAADLPPPRAPPAEDPVRALPAATATRLLQPAAAKVRLRPFTLAFEDPETEARALGFARRLEVGLTCAGSRLFATYYAACTVLCGADIALRGQSVLPAALFAAAALVESSRTLFQCFDAPLVPLSALALAITALVLVPEGAFVTNSPPGLAILLIADMHVLLPSQAITWYVSITIRWLSMQALLWATGWKRALSHLTGPYMMIHILSMCIPIFHYTSQVGSRLRFQAAEHAEHLRRVLAEQADAQERLAKMLTPPHAAGGVAQRWAALATNGAPAEECTMWHWHDIVTVHARLRPRSVARRGLRGAAAVLDGFQQTAWRWGRLQEVLAGAVGRHGGAPGLLEHVESFGDTFIVAGPFPYDAGAAGGDAQQKLAVTAARAAVDFCQAAARALRSDAEVRAALQRARDDPFVGDGELSGGDEAVLLSAALGAGPGQGALVGVEGLAFRLLGLAPREAAALLAALPDGSPCGVQQSVAVASPAFRRLHGAYHDEPLAAAVLAEELQLRHAAASEALLLSRLPAAAAMAPEAGWGHSVASSASSSAQVFRPAGKWRVRGLGVVMASHLRGMNDSDDDDDDALGALASGLSVY